MSSTPRRNTRSKNRKGSARKKGSAKKKRVAKSVIDKRELQTGFMYISIQKNSNNSKFWLGARDIRFADANHKKHMQDHTML